MQADPTYAPPNTVAVPPAVGMAKGARIELRWSDAGTTATLMLGGRRVSQARGELDGPSGRAPKFVRRGKDWFFVFWTFCATCEAQNYARLGKTTITQKGGFESGWAPDFPRTGVVYEYPRYESMGKARKVGREVWIQRTWCWSADKRRFVRLGDTLLRKLPPVPRGRYTQG